MTRAAVDEAAPETDEALGTETGTERRSRRARRGRRRVPLRYPALAVLILAAVGLLAWLLSWWSPVPIREVVVTGSEGTTQDAVLTAADIPTGVPLRDLDRAAIESRVGALPGIDTVELQIRRPWTVVVAVVERFPFAVVAKGDQWTVIDAGGAEINDQKDKPAGLPVIGEVPDRLPVLTALAALPPELRQQIQKGTINKDGDVVLTMKSEVEIVWGLPGPDDATKAQAVAVLLQYEPETINVTVPQRPAITGELKLPKENRAPSPSP